MKIERSEMASAALKTLNFVDDKKVIYDVLLKVYNDHMKLYKNFLKELAPKLMQLQIEKYQLGENIKDAVETIKKESAEKELYLKLSDLKVYELKEAAQINIELKSILSKTEKETEIINDFERIFKRYERRRKVSKKAATKAISLLLE